MLELSIVSHNSPQQTELKKNKCADMTPNKQQFINLLRASLEGHAPMLHHQMEQDSMSYIHTLVQTSAKVETSEVTTDMKDKMSLASVVKWTDNKLSCSTRSYNLSQPIKT